jgi:imidazolonepropionase-like amidohydrolase
MKIIYSFIFFLCIPTITFCQTYITHVTLVDVEKQKLIPEQTVIITGNIISGIQSSKGVRIPANATTVDGNGKFLMPGLIDAHVHFFQSGGLYTRPDAIDLRKYEPYENEIEWAHDNMEDLLRRYTKAGITTVIDPGSTINFLNQRNSFADKIFSPTIFMAGPLLTTYEPDAYKNLKKDEPFNLITNIDEAKAAVQQQLSYHPDFIKIWYITSRIEKNVEDSARKFLPYVKAVIEEAHKNKLRVAVHATQKITAELAVESGCDYLVHSIDDKIISDDFIKLLIKNNITLCPTLIVASDYISTFAQKNKFSDYELFNSSPEPLGSLTDLEYLTDTSLVNNYKQKGLARAAASAQKDSIMMENLKKLVDAGVTIATGTDAGNVGTLHATSYMNELKAMEKSGMSHWQILQASTINGAKAMNKEKEFGSIAVGKKANMILVDGNPVDDLENLKKISYVINKGTVIMPDTLVQESPVQIVQRQLNAYNDRNIDVFLKTYSDDAELYSFPDSLTSRGKDAMRKRYASVFEKYPDLHCEIKTRIIQGNTIIDKEYITATGRKPLEGTVIYKIKNAKISQVYFLK